MEISKSAFEKWLKSENSQIADNAMRIQWTALLEKQNPFFSEDELWAIDENLAAQGLCFALRIKPELVSSALDMLQRRLSDEKKLPVQIWPELMNLASYLLKNPKDKLLVWDFVVQQSFGEKELLVMVDSALRCVDKMPEWLGIAIKWLDKIQPSSNFCIILKTFLIKKGFLEKQSNFLMLAALDKILPEWAPLLIETLNRVPDPYRYDLSLFLFREHFDKQPEQIVKAMTECFAQKQNECLLQNQLDGLFEVFISKKQSSLLDGVIFLSRVKNFLLAHWADNCVKFEKFWVKFGKSPEMFDVLYGADDANYAVLEVASKNDDARLKTPLHMLCDMPIVGRTKWCILLLKFIARGNEENQKLACRILLENSDNLKLEESFDAYYPQLEKILRDGYPVLPEVKFGVNVIANSLLRFGPKVKDVGAVYDFVQTYDLLIPALETCYGSDILALLQKKREERKALDYLLKH